MANVGKKFEDNIYDDCDSNPKIYIKRMRDVQFYAGSTSIADFSIYRKPYLFLVELKTNKGISMSISEKLDDDGNIKSYGRLNYDQVQMMVEASKIDGVYCGYLIEFREDKNNPHGVYYISLETMLEYINNPNRVRKSLSQAFCESRGLRVREELKSSVWTVKEQELLLENKDLTANECYDKVKDIIDRSKSSIKGKFYQVRKDGVKEVNQYIRYKYDIDKLLSDIINQD